MLRQFCSPGGDEGNGYRFGNRGGHFRVEANLRPVTVHGSKKNFACPHLHADLRPFNGVSISALAPAANHDVPMISVALCVDGQDNGLCAKFARKLGDQFGALDGSGVNRDFVGASSHDRAAVFERSNAASRRERNGKLGRDAPDGFQKSGPSVTRSSNIEDDQFIGSFFVITRGQSYGIARIPQAGEIYTLNHALSVRIEAGNDAVCETHAAILRKFCSKREPDSPPFSGWNCTPYMFCLSSTAGNGVPSNKLVIVKPIE